MTHKKILVIAGRYGLSGVPLAQLRMARVLVQRGHMVKLVYGMLNDGTLPPDPTGLDILYLGQARVSSMLPSLIWLLRDYKPDIVFSAGDHLNVFVLLAAWLSGSRAKISCSSRVTPYDTYSNRPFSKGWLLKQMMKLTMARADVLTCVSKDMVDQYRTIFPSSRHVCIYNIIDSDISSAVEDGEDDINWLTGDDARSVVAAGSLESWKGFGDLIEAMGVVVRSVNARLMILGEGSQRATLQRRIDELGLTERVWLRGNVQYPLHYFANAGTFVLPSHVEGLPNVLVEAMLCGCTPVATDCPTGPREVLNDGAYGYLVPVGDPAALAAGILKAFQAPIPADVLLNATHAFRIESVMKQHANALAIDWL